MSLRIRLVLAFLGLAVAHGRVYAAANDGTLRTFDAETGAALVEEGVDKISFTGSVATGRKIAIACAEQLIPCTLELGGKSAAIILDDVDLGVPRFHVEQDIGHQERVLALDESSLSRSGQSLSRLNDLLLAGFLRAQVRLGGVAPSPSCTEAATTSTRRLRL